MKQTRYKSKGKELKRSRLRIRSNLDNYITTNLVILIFLLLSPFSLWMSNKQDFFDRHLNLSPFKVFYFASIAMLCTLTYLISRKKISINTNYGYFLGLLIPLSLGYILISSDWTVLLHSQPDRIITYTSPITWVLAGILTVALMRGSKVFSRVINLIAILVLAYFSSFLILNEFHPYNANSLNLSIVIHPIIQSVFGVGLQSHLRAQYGMYGEILSPFLSAINFVTGNNVNLTQLTIVLSIIFFVSYFSVYLFLRLHSHNKILSALGFVGFLYLSLFAVTTWPSELYFQYYPIRLLFPMTSLLIVFMIGKARYRKYLIPFFSYLTIGLFWNLDVGLFTLLAVLTYYYLRLFFSLDKEFSFHRDLKDVLIPIVTVIATTCIFCLAHFFRFGVGISLELFLASQKLFLSGQIPPINGVWRSIFLVYVCSLTYSIINIHKREDLDFQAKIFFVSLLGLGLFLYFINNPHPAVLSNTWWPAFIILILYTDRLLNSAKTWELNVSVTKILSVILIFPLTWIASASFINLKNSQILKDQVNIVELFDKKSLSKRALWAEPGAAFVSDVKTSSVSYVSVENRNKFPKLQPNWVKKSSAVKRFFLNRPIRENSLAVFSMWDYMIYMDAKSKTPFSAPNFYHTYLQREWLEIEQNLASQDGVEFVIVDDQFGLWRGDTLAHPTVNILALRDLLDNNFDLVETRAVGFTWYLDRWMPNKLKFYVRK